MSAAAPLRAEIEVFVSEVAARHGLDEAALRRLLSEAQTRPRIIRLISTPGTARPWFEYRRRVVEPTRIENGVRFWAQHAAVLERASHEFGVPEELIVATIGVETLYGRVMGSFRVLDALTTLAFDYPPRAPRFRSELEEFLLLAREDRIDARAVRGSYAGAIGIPQFLPSSYRKYAVDFDGDGRRDLRGSVADAIGSVASYYRAFGWEPDAPVMAAVDAGEAELGELLNGGLRPHVKVSELRSRGVAFQGPVSDELYAAVFMVQTESGPQLMLGFNNFYVITRYNRSINYAMSVWELASEIRSHVAR